MILVDTSQQRFIEGADATGDGTSVNVRALYQRCPHLGCKPNPCLKNFWIECPCHGSRYDRLGIKALGPQYGPAPRSMDRFGVQRRQRRLADDQHRQDHARPAADRRRPARDHPAAHADRAASDRDPDARPPPEEPDDRRARPAPAPAGGAPPRDPPGVHAGADGSLLRAAVRAPQRPDARTGGADRPPVRERALGGLPRGHDRGPVRDRLLLLRGRAARRPLEAAARGRARSDPGHLGRAWLQHLPGELRAVPRRQRRGRQGPDPQRARTSCSPTSARSTSTTCCWSAAGTRAATRTASCRSGRTRARRPAR